jgi:hypothetical protein
VLLEGFSFKALNPRSDSCAVYTVAIQMAIGCGWRGALTYGYLRIEKALLVRNSNAKIGHLRDEPKPRDLGWPGMIVLGMDPLRVPWHLNRALFTWH